MKRSQEAKKISENKHRAYKNFLNITTKKHIQDYVSFL